MAQETLQPQQPTVLVPQMTSNYRVWTLTPADHLPSEADFRKQMSPLFEAATKAPSSHNTQPWAFDVDEKDHAVYIGPDWQRRLTESDPTGRELHLSVGAAVANFKVAARQYGLTAQSEIVNDEVKGYRVKLSLAKGNDPSPEEKALYNAINRRFNYDGDHKRTPLTTEAMATIEQAFSGPLGNIFHWVTDQPKKDRIADLVAEGDRAIFNNKGFVRELVRHIRDASTKRKDGIPTFVLKFPRELRRFAARLLLTAKQDMIENMMVKGDKETIKNTAGIGVIATAGDDPRIWLQVGELYQLASLVGVTQGVYFGARAVLIETGDLHEQLERIVGADGARAQMMFRAGYPADQIIYHTPRYPAQERMMTTIEGERRVPAMDSPTIFKLDESYTLDNLLTDIGEVEVESLAYAEHWLPDLFNALHRDLDMRSATHLEQLRAFIDSRNNISAGVWVYYPIDRRLVHHLDEEDFYKVITASNDEIISDEAQLRLGTMRVGVAGLSGSGTEAALAAAMSGVKHLSLADYDFVSGLNLSRLEGQTGENKTWNLAWRLWQHNPFLHLKLFEEGITAENAKDFGGDLDVLCEQTDSTSKFELRIVAREKSIPLIMATDLPAPIIEIERGGPSFGGRADQAGITEDTMNNISSLAESTGYVAILIGPDDLSAANYRNFHNILLGKAHAYGQAFVDTQIGGGTIGRVLITIAEGKLNQLPDSWVVEPLGHGIVEDIKKAKDEFWEAYRRQFGDRFIDIQNST